MGISKVNFGGDTLIDLTNDSVTEGTLAKGATAHNAAGEQVVGTLDVKGTFYVTVTQGDGNSATADKTSEEVYAAYAAGYAVYAIAKLKNSPQFILPLAFALSDSEDGVALGFTLTGSIDPTSQPRYVCVISIFGFWQIFSGFLARQEDIPEIPTALPNPNALTFTGAVTGIYNGSTPLSVKIPNAVTDDHINELINTALNAIGVAEEGAY